MTPRSESEDGFARIPEDLHSLTVTPHEDAEFLVLAADSVALPDHFEAAIVSRDRELPGCGLEVRIIDGRPVCVGLNLWAVSWSGGLNAERAEDVATPITASTLRRIPFGRYLTGATAAAVMPYVREEPPESYGPYTIGGSPAWPRSWPLLKASEQRAMLDLLAEGGRRPQRGIPITDDDLRAVAQLYQAAASTGRRPKLSVAEAMHVSTATASRWIARARERGFLGAARPGVAGEFEPKTEEN